MPPGAARTPRTPSLRQWEVISIQTLCGARQSRCQRQNPAATDEDVVVVHTTFPTAAGCTSMSERATNWRLIPAQRQQQQQPVSSAIRWPRTQPSTGWNTCVELKVNGAAYFIRLFCLKRENRHYSTPEKAGRVRLKQRIQLTFRNNNNKGVSAYQPILAFIT